MKALALLPLPLLLAACTLFKPIEDNPVRHLLEATVSNRTPTAAAPAVAIARPSLPPYLERNELVTRTGDGRLEIHENDLWSEPLDSAISRVVADNLRRLTGSTNIQPAANFITRDYTSLVEIRIERFDPQPDGSLLLECTWKLQPLGGGDAAPKAYRTTVPVTPSADPASGSQSGPHRRHERSPRPPLPDHRRKTVGEQWMLVSFLPLKKTLDLPPTETPSPYDGEGAGGFSGSAGGDQKSNFKPAETLFEL